MNYLNLKRLSLLVIIVLFTVFTTFLIDRTMAENSLGKHNPYYQVFGNGTETLLIINGGPGLDSKGFESLADTISKRYNIKCIIYDQRGTGRSISEISSDNITLDSMIVDIETIRNNIN